MSAQPVKVAILGGGAAGLTAALALTEGPRRGKYDVTVYQMGWRLGGKGASGRNAELGQRTEEHGIHVWFGFYENAFRMMKAVYDELAAGDGRPIRKCFDDAFVPHDFFVLNERLPKGEWSRWPMYMARNAMLPGDGIPLPSRESPVFARLKELLASLRPREESHRRRESTRQPPDFVPADEEERDLDRIVRERVARTRLERTGAGDGPLAATDYIEQALDLVALPDEELPVVERTGTSRGLMFRLKLLAHCLKVARFFVGWHDEHKTEPGFFHRCYLALDTFAAVVRGLAVDVIGPGKKLETLDDFDLREWLIKHGADRDFIADNPSIRFVYNSAFSFQDGDVRKPAIAAGAALRGILRVFLTYKGSLAYRLTGGMGDIVFAPIYEVLRRRGVKFRFFHRVDEIQLSRPTGEKPAVKRIRIGRQVELREHGEEYQPLIDVKGLPSWPNRPRYEQLLGSNDDLALNFEDPACRRKDEKQVVLERGRDFDQVVLAIPVAALDGMCPDLQRDQRWRDMLHHVATTPTQAFQLWFRATLHDLGWDSPEPIFGTYQDPIDTYIDMTPALKRELQDPAHARTLAYFCGVIENKPGETWKDAQARAKQNAHAHLTDRGQYIWPNLVVGGAIDQRLLTGGSFDAQYVRANVLASERYTLALPGSTKFRLAPNGLDFANLFLAGDWTLNPLNLGCVEAAVMSGLECAAKVSESDIEIVGKEDDFIWRGVGLGGREAPAPPVDTAVPWPPDKDLVDAIVAAVDSYDNEGINASCDKLIARIDTGDRILEETHAKVVLDVLRKKRCFDLLQAVADALIHSGQAAPRIRRQYAQGLIDSGQYVPARAMLRELVADPNCGDAERAEALGLIGRIHKQLFVNTFAVTGGRVAEKALRDAIEAYGSVYKQDPEKYPWHGINLVALLMRAKREQVMIKAQPNPVGVATEILRLIELKRDPNMWDCATAAEACVALDRREDAYSWVRRYVDSPSADRFELTSTMRQLQEVWRLDPQIDPGETLLGIIDSSLARAEGWSKTMRPEAVRIEHNRVERRLQRVHGLDGMQTEKWYKTGLERAPLVARIEDHRQGEGVGSGFLVRAGEFLPGVGDPDELLLMTNAHVLSPGGRELSSLAPEHAIVRLEATVAGTVAPAGLRVERVVWSSPVAQLDVTLARLLPSPRGLEPYPVATQLPELKRRQRVYILGYPGGQPPLRFSLNDNLLVDVRPPFLYYRTPTQEGSSGGPVFNDNWELIGIHRAVAAAGFRANEGVCMVSIREALRSP